MKGISAIHQAITENTENILVKHSPHILIHENPKYQSEANAISCAGKCNIEIMKVWDFLPQDITPKPA